MSKSEIIIFSRSSALKSIFVLFGINLFQFSFGQSEREIAAAIVLDLLVDDLKSISYSFEYEIISLDKDTFEYSSNIHFERDESDRIIGGKFWLEKSNENIWYFNRDSIFHIDVRTQEISIYHVKSRNYYGILDNFLTEILSPVLLNKIEYSEKIKDTENTINLFHDSVSGRDIIKIHYKDYPPYYNMTKTLFLNSELKIADGFYSTINEEEKCQNISWKLSKVEIDQVNFEKFDSMLKSFLSIFKINYIEEPEIIQPLKIGETAPALEGRVFQKNTTVNIYNIESSFILLDFFFASCPPCVKQVPILNRINFKYSEKSFSFYSINSIDVEEKDQKRLIEYINENNLLGEVILVDKKVTEEYKVTSYPIIYILDNKRKIVFVERGYSSDLEQRLIDFFDNH